MGQRFDLYQKASLLIRKEGSALHCPRFLIAGTASGRGKTTAALVLHSLLLRRGLRVFPCKCGPDYIDPMFHFALSGVPCSNLDPFFGDRDLLCHLLSRNAGTGLTLIEGVMGYYDGTGKTGMDNSTYTVARMTQTPVILVLDAKGSSASLLAEIEGFLHFVPDSHIRGVLFNRMSGMQYRMVSALMRERFGNRVLPVGYLPVLPAECVLPSRHLGLVPAGEVGCLSSLLQKTADLCEATLALDQIIGIAETAEDLEYKCPVVQKKPPINLAVAKDKAFCFYYGDTLRLFEEMGARLLFFSPLADEVVSADADGLLLGGGYPELHAKQLSANEKAKNSIRSACRLGMPVIAECGGFQYLGAELDGWEMCGVLPHRSFAAGKLVRFGYATLTSRVPGVFGDAGTVLKAHEFHYWDSDDNGSCFTARKADGREREAALTTKTMYAGYPHLYLYGNLPAARAFYDACLCYKIHRP